MIFLISGLQNISQSLYESAWIDGARAWQSFWYITLPMMKRTLLFVIVADTTIARVEESAHQTEKIPLKVNQIDTEIVRHRHCLF